MASSSTIMRSVDQAMPQLATEAEQLARFALDLRLSDVPDAVVAKAKLHLLDGLGVALAATRFDFAGEFLAGAVALGGTGPATALGSEVMLSAANAALVNGALVHGLDFDDTHITAIYHATAPALAAALAMAEATGATGTALLEAYIVGLEIGCRVGHAAEGGFHDRGFHPTALAGTFAAAFAGGRLLGLTCEQLVSASSFAGSQAAGILELGGSLKRLHPGWAAHSGVVAATLAQHGVTGAATVFEGVRGFYQTHLGRTPPLALLPSSSVGQTWLIEGIALKPYPCCHFIHAFVDAALWLRERVTLAEIARIDCPLSKRLHPLVAEPRERRIRPTNPYEAMFSVPYVVALALATGEVDLAAFHDRGIDDPDVLAIAALTWCEEDPDSDFPAHFPGEVRVTLKSGEVVVRRERTSTGTPDRPLPTAQIEAKFLTNATRAIRRQAAERVMSMVESIETLPDAATLTRAMTISSAA